MSSHVYVVTMPELGWDCVVAVLSSTVSISDIEKEYPDNDYIISEMVVSEVPNNE